MRNRRNLFAILIVTGCAEPLVPPQPPPARAAASPKVADPDPGLNALRQPPVLPPDKWADALKAAVSALGQSSIPASPAVGGPGALVVSSDVKGPSIPGGQVTAKLLGSDPPQGEPGPQVIAHRSFIAREPTVSLAADGTATLTARTVRPVPAASVYFGTFVPEEPMGLPRHRRQQIGVVTGTDISLAFPVPKVLREKYDIANVASTGRGVIGWRLEVLDPAEGTSRVTDGTLPFRCSPDCKSEDRRFIQLPSFVTGPFVDLVDTTGATISFTSDAATAAAV
ncbi:MAG: hypothetical protein AAGA56_23715, partial [Myxococcota bacterium]